MTCEKSRIRGLMKMWQISYVGANRESPDEVIRRDRIEDNLLKFKTGARRVSWLYVWAMGKTAVKELEDE